MLGISKIQWEMNLVLTDQLATGRARTGRLWNEIHLIDLVEVHGTDRHTAMDNRCRHGGEGSHDDEWYCRVGPAKRKMWTRRKELVLVDFRRGFVIFVVGEPCRWMLYAGEMQWNGNMVMWEIWFLYLEISQWKVKRHELTGKQSRRVDWLPCTFKGSIKVQGIVCTIPGESTTCKR